MPDSPNLNSSDVLKVTITSDGTALPSTAEVISVEVFKAANRIPGAWITLLDGDMPNDDFPISDIDLFAPGKIIVISAGYGAQVSQIFSGVVVRHGISIRAGNQACLNVECRSKAVKLTIGRNNANYVDMKDSDIISQLISPCGLSADVKATSTQHKELVQYYSSDWDFIVARAEANGMLVIADDDGIAVKPPQTSAAAVLSVTYGTDLMEFEADIDARTQLSSVVGAAWDPGTQAVVQQTASPASLYEQGNLSAATLAEVASPSSYRLQTTVALPSADIKSWAEARQMKAALARIRGRMKFQGSASAKPGVMIDLVGVGKRFSGSVYISGVTHRLGEGNWITEAEFGMAPDWFMQTRGGAEELAASGLLPGVGGLQIGVVKKLDADPEGQYKIQVAISVLQASTEGVWARLASFYGSSGVGAFFIPEIGDEVIVGYFNNDPSHPVVLGSLYSSQRKMPYELTAENYTKALWTKGLLKVVFDDEKKVVTIVTPANNTIVLSDDAKSICLTDQNSNKIEMSTSGILLDSPKDIVLNAKGKVTITAVQNIENTTQATLQNKGLDIKNNASVSFLANGAASAELSASGQTTVKGAMVMIN